MTSSSARVLPSTWSSNERRGGDNRRDQAPLLASARSISAVNDPAVFGAGERLGDPAGNPGREAVASLRGYTYQLYASALAWLRLADGELLHLEVAEDYMVAAANALQGVQVRDTPSSNITIRSVAPTIDVLVDLVGRNPGRVVSLRYLTTSLIGLERASADRIDGGPALEYWRRAAKGAPIAPLRALLLRLPLKRETVDFIETRSDEELREELIRRIHWDAGQAPLDELAEELEAGLIEFAVSTLRLNADVGRHLVDLALVSILKASVRPERERRRLRRAQLIAIGESLGRVSVPREVLDALIAKGGTAPTNQSLLFLGEILSTGPVANRPALVDSVREEASQSSFAVVSGSTGMGKTFVASGAAHGYAGGWKIAELRGLAPAAATPRLDAILGEAAASPSDVILLDDLDCLDDPAVQRAARRLVTVMRRRDGAVIVTCALPPTRRTMELICGSPSMAIEVPYLTIDEVADLIDQAGGNPRWARLIHLSGSAGHPLLVQAAIMHMRAANWERGAIRELLDGEVTDIVEEKRAARDRLVAAMPAGARAMLFRMSLILGRFTRELALKLGDVDPTIAEPGTEIDRLIGPWIERPHRNDLRVSPLVANAAQAVLSPAERIRVHQTVADHYLRASNLSSLDADEILHHTLAGGDEAQVFAYADALITASSEALETLARYSAAIGALTTEGPIFPANVLLSVMLRLGQLLVALSGDDSERAAAIWSAMKREMADESETFEVLVLTKILIKTVIVRAIPEWLELLLRLDALTQTNDKLRKIVEESEEDRDRGEPQGLAFILQAASLGSTRLLRLVFDRLDAAAPDVRDRLFSIFERSGGGHFGHLVDSAWLKSAKTDGFDGEHAAADYLAMADLAQAWDKPALAARCHAARAIMLEEYVKDPARAMTALDEAQAKLGPMTSLSRARARIQWRQQDHHNALRGLELVWNDGAADSDPVERGFIAREAGISAAETGDWAGARTWFERARSCFEPLDTGILSALKIGLLGDAAQAAYKAGDPVGAIEGYAQALDELPTLDPESSLNAAYCHRIIGHSVLWLMRETRDEALDVELADLPPGSCSNPDPIEGIRSVPRAPLDISWYMLADAALDLGQPDLFLGLYDRLTAGPIIGLEAERQYRLAKFVVSQGFGKVLPEALKSYGSALAYLEARSVEVTPGDIANPNRGSPRLYALDGSEPEPAKRGASDLILSYGILRAIDGDREALRKARKDLDSNAWASVRGLAKLMIGAEGDARWLTEYTATTIAEVAEASGLPVDPVVALRATVRFAIWASRSKFRDQLAGPIGDWASAMWQKIIDEHRFRLRNPAETSGQIATAAASGGDPLGRAARIALAADAAVPMIVPDGVRLALADLAAANSPG